MKSFLELKKYPDVGERVHVRPTLDEGLFVEQALLGARREDAGIVLFALAGHGDDAYIVQYDDGTRAAFWISDIYPIIG